MRITTNAILRGYKSNLSTTFANLEDSRTKASNFRKFNSVAEDPTAAARASTLHRSFYKNEDYLGLINDVKSSQEQQESALTDITTMAKTISKKYGLEALNGDKKGNEDSRKTYATAIRSLQGSMVSSLNASYEDTYVFAGSDGMNVPFVLSDDGTLTYRGIDVNAASGTNDYTKLSEYAQEKKYVDLGMGLTIDSSGDAVSSSAFNTSLPGIKSAGYGKDSDGLSNNIVVLTGQLADELDKDTFDQDKYEKILNKIDSVRTSMLNDVSQLGVKSNFLTSTKNRLTDQQTTLQVQMQRVESMDLTEMAGAYTEFSWNHTAYQSALKVGTSILSSSFIDFMR